MIAWRHYVFPPQDGTARGYMNLSYFLYHALASLTSLEDIIAGLCPRARVVLHVASPHMFRPIPRRRNVLFSMWEGDVLPKDVVEPLSQAEYRVVPSHYCQHVWKQHGLTSEVVPLGLHDAFLTANTERALLTVPGRRLRFLCLASKDVRKGWQVLAPGWKLAFGEAPHHVELYVKTIGDSSLKHYEGGAVTVDQRLLEPADVMRLYESASVFVFPSFGEGFGLPALEAMACGCLVIAPESTGLTEFVDATTALLIPQPRRALATYGERYWIAAHGPEDVAGVLRKAEKNWGRPALELIRRNGIDTARRFAWSASAEKLAAILNRIDDEAYNNSAAGQRARRQSEKGDTLWQTQSALQ